MRIAVIIGAVIVGLVLGSFAGEAMYRVVYPAPKVKPPVNTGNPVQDQQISLQAVTAYNREVMEWKNADFNWFLTGAVLGAAAAPFAAHPLIDLIKRRRAVGS